MKALVYTEPNVLSYREEPDPQAEDDEVVVKVEAVGICGSDLHAYRGEDERRPAPLILGHEAIGHVVSGRWAGKRVAINPLVTCGTCEYCQSGHQHICNERQIISMAPRPGAFAEYVRIPMRNLVEIPECLSASQAALAEPIAVSYHAVCLGKRLLQTVPIASACCVVLGGGPIGLTAALSLTLHGANDIAIVEVSEERRRTLSHTSSFLCNSITEIESKDSTVDLIIDAVGSSNSRALACHLAKPGATIVHVGLHERWSGIDARKVTLRQIIFTGSYCYTPQEFSTVVHALIDQRFGTFAWVEERCLADGQRAFTDLVEGRARAIKILLRP